MQSADCKKSYKKVLFFFCLNKKGLIRSALILPDECVKAVISIMTNMLPQDKKNEALGIGDTKKMEAYYEMQKLRKITAAYEITDYDAEREYAVSEKYGAFSD